LRPSDFDSPPTVVLEEPGPASNRSDIPDPGQSSGARVAGSNVTPSRQTRRSSVRSNECDVAEPRQTRRSSTLSTDSDPTLPRTSAGSDVRLTRQTRRSSVQPCRSDVAGSSQIESSPARSDVKHVHQTKKSPEVRLPPKTRRSSVQSAGIEEVRGSPQIGTSPAQPAGRDISVENPTGSLLESPAKTR
jgi:hypothetical protein